MAKPILVMQMQRMGDLILSFPLFLWLKRQYPGRDIWVLAEKAFYEPLMPISPEVTYFPWEGTDFLLRHEFELALNLSIRDRAAALAGKLKAERKLGPVQEKDGIYIHGKWQLYRASLVRNNRYNRFHWADLNALDVIDLPRMAKTSYDPPGAKREKHPQVGLFLGASDEAKRPGPAFWAGLCGALVERGIRPALFGGPAEKDLGQEVRRSFKRPIANFCGTFGLDQLSKALRTLALFVTPDTGPMHLAAWNGCPTLNLSMGNVSPWETGPYPPGHTVLRADIPCAAGCWECTRSRLYCHDPFRSGPPEAATAPVADSADMAAVAAFIARMAKGRVPSNPPPGTTMHFSDRTAGGLYRLRPAQSGPPSPHQALSRFWQAFFGWRLGLWDEDKARLSAISLADAADLTDPLARCIKGVRAGLAARTVPDLWTGSDETLRPFTGWAQLALENDNASPAAFKSVLDTARALRDLLR